jgi:hypothetical protein
MEKIIRCLATGWEEGLVLLRSTVTVSIFGRSATVDCDETVIGFAKSEIDGSSNTLLSFFLRGQAVPGVLLTPSHKGR